MIGNNSPKQRPNGSSDTTNRLCLFPLRHVSNRRDCSQPVRFGLDKSCREFSRVVILKILNYSLLNEDDLKINRILRRFRITALIKSTIGRRRVFHPKKSTLLVNFSHRHQKRSVFIIISILFYEFRLMIFEYV